MSSQSNESLSLERYAWVTAYIQHFEPEPIQNVVAALGFAPGEYEREAAAHTRRMTERLSKRDHGTASQFARELALAKARLAEEKPTLDDVRATYSREAPAKQAAVDVDQTAFIRAYVPDVILPFQQSAVPATPVAAAEESAPNSADTSGTLIMVSPFATKMAVPFDGAQAAPSAGEDRSPGAPPPKKA